VTVKQDSITSPVENGRESELGRKSTKNTTEFVVAICSASECVQTL
jgi:hypothetical protein